MKNTIVEKSIRDYLLHSRLKKNGCPKCGNQKPRYYYRSEKWSPNNYRCVCGKYNYCPLAGTLFGHNRYIYIKSEKYSTNSAILFLIYRNVVHKDRDCFWATKLSKRKVELFFRFNKIPEWFIEEVKKIPSGSFDSISTEVAKILLNNIETIPHIDFDKNQEFRLFVDPVRENIILKARKKLCATK